MNKLGSIIIIFLLCIVQLDVTNHKNGNTIQTVSQVYNKPLI
jgi:hypothetical protein